MNEQAADLEFEQRFARVEGLLADLSASSDPQLERSTREVLATVLELHRRGLTRLLEIAALSAKDREALARDARVGAMLLLHGLHPLSLDERVALAVERLRARFQDRLAEVLVQSLSGTVAVRLVPQARACGSTRATLKRDFEEALLAAAPDADSVSVELAEPAPALVTLRIRRPTHGAPREERR